MDLNTDPFGMQFRAVSVVKEMQGAVYPDGSPIHKGDHVIDGVTPAVFCVIGIDPKRKCVWAVNENDSVGLCKLEYDTLERVEV